MLNQLKIFKSCEGHCKVPITYNNQASLGSWVYYQKIKHKKFLNRKPLTMMKEQIKTLDQIGFWENTNDNDNNGNTNANAMKVSSPNGDNKWWDNFDKLLRFYYKTESEYTESQ